jgi:hypothetical protein
MTGGKNNRRKRRKKGGQQKNSSSLFNDAVDISAYTATLFLRLNWKIFGRMCRAMIQVISWVLPEQKERMERQNVNFTL